MRVYILMSVDYRKVEVNDVVIYEHEDKAVHSVHSTKADAKSEYVVSNNLGEWKHDDWEIEEFDL